MFGWSFYDACTRVHPCLNSKCVCAAAAMLCVRWVGGVEVRHRDQPNGHHHQRNKRYSFDVTEATMSKGNWSIYSHIGCFWAGSFLGQGPLIADVTAKKQIMPKWILIISSSCDTHFFFFLQCQQRHISPYPFKSDFSNIHMWFKIW